MRYLARVHTYTCLFRAYRKSRLDNIAFHDVDNPEVLAFSKRTGDDCVLVVVNLDPHGTREATVHLDLPALGRGWDDTFPVHDEVTGADYTWGAHNYVRLDPFIEPAHVFVVGR